MLPWEGTHEANNTFLWHFTTPEGSEAEELRPYSGYSVQETDGTRCVWQGQTHGRRKKEKQWNIWLALNLSSLHQVPDLHHVSFIPCYDFWDRCDFCSFSSWKTETQRSYTASTCLNLDTNKELRKSLTPKLLGLINPKAHILLLTPQPPGKVLEGHGGRERKEKKVNS